MLVVLLIGVSYSIYNYNFIGNKNTVKAGDIKLELLESNTNIVNIANQLPITDKEGKEANSFDFAVTSNTSIDRNINYEIYIEELETTSGYTKLSKSQIKLYLTDYSDNQLVSPTLISRLKEQVLYSGTHSHNSNNVNIVEKFKLRAWIDYNVDASSWTEDTKLEYKFKIGVRTNGLNDYGFYFDKPYSAEFEGDINSFVFYENGSAEMLVNGESIQTLPEGTVIYSYKSINIDSSIGIVSGDGKQIDLGEGFILTLEEDIYPEFGVPYVYDTNPATADDDVAFIFYEDKAYIFIGYQMTELEAQYNRNTVLAYNESIGAHVSFNVFDNGDKISASFDGNSMYYIDTSYAVADDYYLYRYDKDLDGWNVRVIDDTLYSYGNIQSSINDKPIVSLTQTFNGCSNLTIAPKIPSTVKEMYRTFGNCTSLKAMPVIPEGVEYMNATFYQCTNLKTSTPIPSSVKILNSTFKGCESLTGNIEINSDPEDYAFCFEGTKEPIKITGTSTTETKANLATTANNGNVSY